MSNTKVTTMIANTIPNNQTNKVGIKLKINSDVVGTAQSLECLFSILLLKSSL